MTMERKMAKLTDTQLIVLSKAAAREDGIATIPNKMTKAAAAKVGASLLARKLMREVRAKPGMPIWRAGEDSRPLSLVITAAGRKAINAGDEADVEPQKADRRADVEGGDAPKRGAGARQNARVAVDRDVPSSASPRTGSKQALVIKMLSAKSGTTLDALVDATGWLPHTTRAALTGLRKRGFAVERTRTDGAASVYRIAKPAADAVAA